MMVKQALSHSYIMVHNWQCEVFCTSIMPQKADKDCYIWTMVPSKMLNPRAGIVAQETKPKPETKGIPY